MKRRNFLKGCGALGVAASLNSIACAQSPDPTQLSVAELRAQLDGGRLKASEVLSAFVDRIKRLDPKLHSVIELNPDAEKLAAAWKPSQGGALGGIPVLLKDNIATADRMVTSAGSAALANSRYPVDSGVAARLREAGAILLGKANMSEWANYRSNNSTSGWSARGGQCRNPYALDRSPCGSSSGSAVAVSASLAPLAIGTETVGSIVCPSGMCGIVGFKPTFGLVPGDHIIPIATSWDTAGPMARSVADVSILLGTLASKDYGTLIRGSLQGARLGVARECFGFDWRVDRLLGAQLKVLESLGATLVDNVDVPTWKDYGSFASEVMAFEFKAGVNDYLAGQPKGVKIRSLAHVIAFNESNPEVEAMDFLGQPMLRIAQEKGGLRSPEYLAALAEIKKLTSLEEVFEEHKLDAIVGPTNGAAWKIDFVNGDHYEGGSAGVAAVGGYPHITVPGGFLHELPLGLSFIGRRFAEKRLLGLAYDFEQATRHRRAPRFLTTLDGKD